MKIPPTYNPDDLSEEQLRGQRCVICNSDWIIEAATGSGGRIAQVPVETMPNGEILFMCWNH